MSYFVLLLISSKLDLVDRLRSNEAGRNVETTSYFLGLFSQQSDVVLLRTVCVEDSTVIEPEEAKAANIVTSHVLVQDLELYLGSSSGSEGSSEGVVPGDGLVFLSMNNLGLELS